MSSVRTERIAVIIPTYNEKENIIKLISEMLRVFQPSGKSPQIIVVDDNSPDGTAALIRSTKSLKGKVTLVKRPGKLGLGSAYVAGYKTALQTQVGYVIQMDADLSHPPETALDLLQAIEDGYDLAIASRYTHGGGVRSWTWKRLVMSRLANFFVMAFLRTGLNDNTSGYRAMSAALVKKLVRHDIKSSGFAYLVEMSVVISRLKLKIREVPFTYEGRENGATKLSFGEVMRFFATIGRLLVSRTPHEIA